MVAHRHAPSASAADDEALEQGGSLAGWPGCAVVAAGGGVGGQDLQVGLVAGPGDIAGVVVGKKDGPVLGRLDQRVVVPVQVGGVAGAAVAVGAGVAGVVQDLEDLVVGERLEVQLACAWSAAVPGREGQLCLAEGPDHGEGGAGGGEGVEQQADRAAHSAVGIQDRFAAAVVGQPDRQLQLQLAAAGLGQDPAAQPGPQEMQFCLAELAFHSQEEAVVEAGRVIQPVLVQDEGVVVGADLQQPVPVCVVAGQPRAFQAEYDPCPAQGHLGDQVLEPFPVRGGGSRMALVDVDHVDPAGGPAERDGPAAQVVLARGGLGVVGDLVEGGLADVEVGVAAEPGRGHLAAGIGTHGGTTSWAGNGAGRAWASVICASTATISLVA